MKKLLLALLFLPSLVFADHNGPYPFGSGGSGTTINNTYIVTNVPSGWQLVANGGFTNATITGSTAGALNFTIGGGSPTFANGNQSGTNQVFVPAGLYYLQAYAFGLSAGTNFTFTVLTNQVACPLAVTVTANGTANAVISATFNVVSNTIMSMNVQNNGTTLSVPGAFAQWSLFMQVPAGVLSVTTTNIVINNTTNNTTNAFTLNGLAPAIYLPKFVETNHISSFGAYPNGYVTVGVSVTNTWPCMLTCPNGFIGASNVLVTPVAGERIIINYAGNNGQFFRGTISNVISPYALWLNAPVPNGLTNFAYAIICTTNSEAVMSSYFQTALNNASNFINYDLIIDPPLYYNSILGSNSVNPVGQCYVLTTNGNWQLPTMNNAMLIVPPILAANTNHYGGKAAVTIEGQYAYQPWGTGPGESYLSYAPNESVIVVDAIGNDQTGSNYIGNSFLDFRAFGTSSFNGAGPSGLLIPNNDCRAILKNFTLIGSYDSHMAFLNLAGAADGTIMDNVEVIGGDQGSTLGGASYEFGLKHYPSGTNSIGVILPDNFQGNVAFINYCQIYGEWAAFEEGQGEILSGTAGNCSNVIDLAYSPGVAIDFYRYAMVAFNFAHVRNGIVNPPSNFNADIFSVGAALMPAGTTINIINDEYYLSDHIHDGLNLTTGHIYWDTNINAGIPIVYTNWNVWNQPYNLANALQGNTSLQLSQIQGDGLHNLNSTYSFNGGAVNVGSAYGSVNATAGIFTNGIQAGGIRDVSTSGNPSSFMYNGNAGIYLDTGSGSSGQFETHYRNGTTGSVLGEGAFMNNNTIGYGGLPTPTPGNDYWYWVDKITSQVVMTLATNGNLSILGVLNATNGASLGGPITPNNISGFGTIINTNWVLGGKYSFTFPVLVNANAILTTAGVAGNSDLDLEVAGNTTNRIAIQTIPTSIASSYTNYIGAFIPANTTFDFTNRSSGTGDSAAVYGGQYIIQ